VPSPVRAAGVAGDGSGRKLLRGEVEEEEEEEDFFEKTAAMTARAVAAIELDEARRLGRRFDRADRIVASWAR
jgi:hypothetical protein